MPNPKKFYLKDSFAIIHKEHTKQINEKLRSLEVHLQNKTDTTEMEKLQRIENIENSIRKLGPGGVRTKKVNYGQL